MGHHLSQVATQCRLGLVTFAPGLSMARNNAVQSNQEFRMEGQGGAWCWRACCELSARDLLQQFGVSHGQPTVKVAENCPRHINIGA